MRISVKQYREQAYRLRSHPHSPRNDELDFHDGRDSFTMVYLSVIPFAVLEYFTEISVDSLPGGLVFPVGFLLFWAFYYTYYKPGFLENRLTAPPGHFDLTWIPSLIVGILIWFVKVTFVELSHLVLLKWWVAAKPAAAKPKAAAAGAPPPRNSGSGPHKAPPALLPPDLVEALTVLGLKPGCNWASIHKQYRMLAKQFHPDLNPDITDFGHRFMKVDQAYHKLEKVRAKHFPN